MVVMRGRRLDNNLYHMEGSVVTGEFDAAAAAQDLTSRELTGCGTTA